MAKKLYKALRSYDKTEIVGQLIYIDGSAHIIQDDDIEECGHHFHQISDRPTWVDEDTITEVDGNMTVSVKSDIVPDTYVPTVKKVQDFKELSPGNMFFIFDSLNGVVKEYYFASEHPLHKSYILAIDIMSGNADAIGIYKNDLIKDINDGNVYIGTYDPVIFSKLKMEYHERKADEYRQIIQDKLNFIKS
ncbi:MAG: hypothetical protein [Wendovervirus sonii]|uniref:Uncharacterized protein n=1 Tax=phage Lak_Megaphage_Sonny TaxID=3109229 RepID=A0ABZ0Z3U7_9CAUD|nr:MAG: hypothetical protein [phage Lak_Megaphage_Sonny]